MISYWNFKSELDANRSEIDVNELDGLCDKVNPAIDAIENVQRDEAYENKVLENFEEHGKEVDEHNDDDGKSQRSSLGNVKETNFVTWWGALCIPLVILVYVFF